MPSALPNVALGDPHVEAHNTERDAINELETTVAEFSSDFQPLLPSQADKTGLVLGTDGTNPVWVETATVDTVDSPQAPGSPAPGNTGLASDAGHVHPLPTPAQLLAQGAVTAASLPLWQQINAGNLTLPRGHGDDSDSYGQTPASGVDHYTYFIAQKPMTVGHIRYAGGGKAQVGGNTQLGLFSVNPSNGALTMIATSTAKSISGTYSQATFTMTAVSSGSSTIIAGTLYAVGIIQVVSGTGAVAGSIMGAWFNAAFLGGTPALALTGGTGKTALPASVTPAGTSNFPFYYELVA